ncbi:hypothetical protein ABZO35_26675 [Burkholderia pseudomallei]|uniref:hypothetical protein n=1 Tax=Burkholderia pseudomallei TaxID=28450 RepID=UPI00016AE8E0|nr:hypothetical protein [Burkholderia pseudomallei]ARK71619.1 hypothetical protein BOC38_35085 [Burkholderia pseudomallei]ARK90597.1 hypothetical protein BOC42_25135 [Burkholderia pseudomallei]ARL40808.1 hypothetical protein BOC49_33355 [Burkholderia pseudomallei]OMQ76085.1 hypothetical protein AQ713_01845 [Burkholderia pseudomallei]
MEMKRLDPTMVEFRDSPAADLRPGVQRFFAQAGTNGHISVTKRRPIGRAARTPHASVLCDPQGCVPARPVFPRASAA